MLSLFISIINKTGIFLITLASIFVGGPIVFEGIVAYYSHLRKWFPSGLVELLHVDGAKSVGFLASFSKL